MRTPEVNAAALPGGRFEARRPRLLDRVVFRVAYAVCMLTGRAAASLAADFRELGRCGRGLWPLTTILQVPLVACWLVVRPLSLGSFALCAFLAPRLGHS